MTCRETAKLLDLFVDGELSGRGMREVALHVTRCDPCGREIRERERLQDIIADSLEERAADVDVGSLWSRIEAEIGQGGGPWERVRGLVVRPLPGRPTAPALWGGLVAAMLVGLLAGGLWWQRADEGPSGTEVARRELRIHSLSATSPVAVIREPESNTAVIWVGDEPIPIDD